MLAHKHLLFVVCPVYLFQQFTAYFGSYYHITVIFVSSYEITNRATNKSELPDKISENEFAVLFCY